ncbi:MAG: hypothetical protein ACYDH9_08045 [Limisphaerales bacterium]
MSTKTTNENPKPPLADAIGSELDALSRTVTTLCQAIDPESSHGPETEKIADYATTTRKLAAELMHAVCGQNRTYQLNKAREVREHLGIRERANGGIIGSEDWPPAPEDD